MQKNSPEICFAATSERFLELIQTVEFAPGDAKCAIEKTISTAKTLGERVAEDIPTFNIYGCKFLNATKKLNEIDSGDLDTFNAFLKHVLDSYMHVRDFYCSVKIEDVLPINFVEKKYNMTVNEYEELFSEERNKYTVLIIISLIQEEVKWLNNQLSKNRLSIYVDLLYELGNTFSVIRYLKKLTGILLDENDQQIIPVIARDIKERTDEIVSYCNKDFCLWQKRQKGAGYCVIS